MEKKDFEAYLKKGEELKPTDIDDTIKEWKQYVNELYETINNWLEDYVGKEISIRYQEIFITEELTGEYSINKMIINTKEKQIELKPYGAFVVGLKGRVDMEGPNSKIMLGICRKGIDGPTTRIRFDEKGKISLEVGSLEQKREDRWVWKLITSPPHTRYIELTKEVFFDLFVGA